MSKSFKGRKRKNRQYGQEQHKNHPENEKQRLIEYKKKNITK